MQGQFTTKDNKTCTVTIGAGSGTIGSDDLYFAKKPVVIKQNISDTFTEIIKTTCKIKLITTSFHSDLFTNNDRGIKVNVTVGDDNVFTGYVTPNTYSQPYANHLTEFTINCQDYLSTLKNHKYKESSIQNTKSGFNSAKAAASNVSFKSILTDMGITSYNLTHSIWKDTTILDELYISEHILLGDAVDDVMTCEEILEEICKFLDVHAVMIAGTIYFFDWQTKQTASTSSFADAVCSNDTTISIADVYNQLKLKCDIKEEEQIIDSPTSDDAAYSPFSSKVLYETEYWVWGEGTDAQNAYKNIIQGKATDFEEAYARDYYIQLMKSNNWDFNYNLDTTRQTYNLATLNTQSYKCFLMSTGIIDKDTNKGASDAPISKIDTSNCLYIKMPALIKPQSGEGWTSYKQTDYLTQQKMDEDSGSYLAKYNGNKNGGALGATDDNTTNYFVFSGNIILKTPYHKTSETWTINETEPNIETKHRFDQTKNADGAIYGTRFYDDSGNKTQYQSLELFNSNFTMKDNNSYADHVFELTHYTSSSDTDKISKVPVLKCYMSIGEKDLIETSLGVYEWVEKTDTSKTNCLYSNAGTGGDSTYIEAHKNDHIFTLGFNPGIGDYVFNTEHKIANTISYTQNIDAEGTAIPLPTGITGEIEFKILSPVATVWEANVCVKQPSTWNHSVWRDRTCEIMPFVDSIIIKDFECKITSDDANRTNYEEQDLIYVLGSTGDSLLGIKDDIEFKFSTALTTAQATEAGQNSGAKLSNVIKGNLPFTGFDDDDDKSEKRYITNYYTEYKEPRIIVDTTLSTSKTSGYWQNFTIPTLGGSFEVLSMEMDIRENKTKFKLKQY